MSDYQKLLEMWREEKRLWQEVEKTNETLKADLARAKEDAQYNELKHKRDIEDLMKGKIKQWNTVLI